MRFRIATLNIEQNHKRWHERRELIVDQWEIFARIYWHSMKFILLAWVPGAKDSNGSEVWLRKIGNQHCET